MPPCWQRVARLRCHQCRAPGWATFTPCAAGARAPPNSSRAHPAPAPGCFGVRPGTSYAEGLDRRDDGGIVVDANLCAAPGLYAAGDIASFPHRGDGEPIRVEHWRVAEQHGRVAALNMLGQTTRYDAVPFFWTIQYMKRFDYVGHATEWDSVVLHGDVSDAGKSGFLAYYVKDGRVAAAAGLGRDEDTAALIELFTMRRDWTAAALGESPAAVLAAAQ